MRAFVRHTISAIAAMTVVMGVILAGTAPAQAAAFVELSVSDTDIQLGETVYLNWFSDDDDIETLVASGDWSGNKSIDGVTEEAVTPAAVGTFTYTLTAGDSEGEGNTTSVTVEVGLPNATQVTPGDVTFPDECTVVIPDTEGVAYFYQFAGANSYEPIEAGTTPGAFFFNYEDLPTRFFARAAEGYAIADDATTEWFYTSSEDCQDFGPQLLDVAVDCGLVEFTNVFTDSVFVQYGLEGNEAPDGAVTVEPGESETVETKHAELYFVSSSGDAATHYEYVDVPQDCGVSGGSDHPTVAPAAGR